MYHRTRQSKAFGEILRVSPSFEFYLGKQQWKEGLTEHLKRVPLLVETSYHYWPFYGARPSLLEPVIWTSGQFTSPMESELYPNVFLDWLLPKNVLITELIMEQDVSLTVEIERLLRVLEQQIRLKEPGRIVNYLLQFPELIEVIPKAVDAAQKHFPEAQLVLEVYQDPEIENEYLALYVRLKRYDDSVAERLEKAEAEFLDLLATKDGWLQLTTDFQEPEAGEDAF